jgi:hypothetical protein
VEDLVGLGERLWIECESLDVGQRKRLARRTIVDIASKPLDATSSKHGPESLVQADGT